MALVSASHAQRAAIEIPIPLRHAMHGYGAVTLGNTQLYAGSVTPDTPTRSYDNGPEIRTGDHEEGHSYQYQDRGVGFLAEYLPGGLQSGANPFEQAADAGARGGNPIP